jgi:hypothetical protein
METADFTIFDVSPVGKTEKIVKHVNLKRTNSVTRISAQVLPAAGAARLPEVLCA